MLSLTWEGGTIPLEADLVSANPPEQVADGDLQDVAGTLIDRALDRGVWPGVVVCEHNIGIQRLLPERLVRRSIEFALRVDGALVGERIRAPLERGHSNRVGRPKQPPRQILAIEEMVYRLPGSHSREIQWTLAGRGSSRSRFARLRIRVNLGQEPSSIYPQAIEGWLLAEWADGPEKPVAYWFLSSGLGPDILDLVYWTKICRLTALNREAMVEQVGFHDFRGRSYKGWRHHTTLGMIASLFLTLESIRTKSLLSLEAA